MQNERVRVTVRVRNMGRGMKEKGKQVAKRVHQKRSNKKTRLIGKKWRKQMERND